MRLMVTVVSPATGRQADIAIEAGPGTTLAQVAAELDRLMHGMPAAVPEPWVPALFVWRPGQQVTIGNTLLELVPYEPPAAALNPAEAATARLPRVAPSTSRGPNSSMRACCGPAGASTACR